MDSIFEHYKKNGYLHHAYIIEGLKEDIQPLLLSHLERYMGIVTESNPNLIVLEYQSFGIDESRDLSLRQSHTGFDDSSGKREVNPARKIFIISAKSFTAEAQNALLKTFEEPTSHTHFFVIIPRIHTILPTLASRVVLLKNNDLLTDTDELKDLAEKFLDDTSLAKRFDAIKKLTEAKKNEVVDREKIRCFLDHIERILYTRLAGIKDQANVFHEIYQAKTYLADRGSSPKMLLEHLAMALPL